MTAYIAYDAIGADSARQLSLTGTDTGFWFDTFPVENMLDYSTYTVGRFGSDQSASDFIQYLTAVFNGNQTIEYIAIMQHDLPFGATVGVGPNVFPPAPVETFTVNTQGPLLFKLATPFTDTGAVFDFRPPGGGNIGTVDIGVIMYGTLLPLPEGMEAPYTPPPMGRSTVTYPSTSGTGNFLQSHVERVGWDFTINQRNVDPTWMNTHWPALVEHVERYPFFYSWDHEGRPEDCMYGWIARSVKPPRYQNPLYMAWSMTCRGLHE